MVPDLQADRLFARKNRLRGRSNFLAVSRKENSKRLKGSFCRITMADSDSSETEFGISISRGAGGAVRRNRLKRIIREFLRNNKPLWPSGKMIVIWINSPVADDKALSTEIERLLREL